MKEQMNVPKLRFGEFEGESEPLLIQDFAKVTSGGTPNRAIKEYWGGSIPWITTSQINYQDINGAEEFITDEGLKNSSAKLFPKGTLLLALYGQGVTRGRVSILNMEATTNQACAALILDGKKSNNRYMLFNLQARYEELRALSNSGGQKNLSGGLIKSLPVALPTLDEQQKIASFLSKVDEKIALLTEKKHKLTEYKKGVMQQLFNGKWDEQDGQLIFIPPTLRFKADDGSEFPDWTKSTLGDIGKVKMCKRIMANQTSENGDIPFFKIGTFGREPDAFISQELYDEYRHKFSFPNVGDILMSASGTLGRTVVYDGSPAYFQDSNIVWIENDGSFTTNEFLFYVYQIVKYQSEGGTIQRLYNNIIMSAVFDNPSLKEQKKIVKFLSAIDQKIDLANSELEKAKEWKRGLLQQMFV